VAFPNELLIALKEDSETFRKQALIWGGENHPYTWDKNHPTFVLKY
jgi:hypothetical protein